MADVSSYRQGGAMAPVRIDPLAQMNQLLQIQSGLNQNQVFQQEFADQAAINKVMNQTPLDKESGRPDTNQLLKNMHAAGLGRLMPKVMEQLQTWEQRQGQIDQTHIENANKRFNTFNNVISGLIIKPDLTTKDIVDAGLDGINQQLFTPKELTAFLTKIPPDAKPDQLRQNLLTLMAQGNDFQKRLQATVGSPVMVDKGGSIQPGMQSPITGAVTAGGPEIRKTLTPGEASAPRSMLVPTPGGGTVKVDVPASTWLSKGGGATELPRNMFGLNQTEMSQPAEWFDGKQQKKGTYGQFLEQAVGASGMRLTAGGPGGGGSPGVAAGPPLGAVAAANETGNQSAKQGAELQKLADAVPQRKANLETLEQKLPDFKGGPMADRNLYIKEFANQFGIPWDKKGVASQEEFNKVAGQIALAQLQNLGTGTDEKLGTAVKSNPSSLLSNMGNKQIIQMLKGNEDAIAVKQQAWQQWLDAGNGTETFGSFQKEFNKVYNPRVFQFVYMDPKERTDMINKMSKSERSKFVKSLDHAEANGWVVPQ